MAFYFLYFRCIHRIEYCTQFEDVLNGNYIIINNDDCIELGYIVQLHFE